jgi:two-component system sensor histidine kinase HydH
MIRSRTSRTVTILALSASVLLLAIGAAGAWYVRVLQGKASWALADNVPSIRASYRFTMALSEVRHALDDFLQSNNRRYLTAAVALQTEVDRQAKDVTHFASTDYEFGLCNQLNAGLERFSKRLNELASDPSLNTLGEVRKLEDENLANEVLPYSKKYLDFNEQELAERSRANETMASRLSLALAVLGVCGAAAGLIAGFSLARGIRRTMYQLSIPLRDVAGRLNQVVGPITVGEEPAMEDLEGVLKVIAAEVTSVVEKFHATNRQIIRADQLAALGQLAAGLAHELYNPLMCVKILVQSARAEGAPALDRDDLQVLDQEIARLENLLQSFLTFARPAKLERREIDLRTIVSQTVTLLAARAARRKIVVDYRPPTESVLLSADEAQLRQVALNLLLNALDAIADAGKLWIEVGFRGVLPSGELDAPAVRMAYLSVADNGRGVSPEARERIFEPFFSTKETGLGLGLAICQRIVELHDGAISATNRLGGGTIFTVLLPLKSGSATAAARLPEPAPELAMSAIHSTDS